MAETRILIVEDDNIVVMELRDRLQNMGYIVTGTTPYAEKALEQAEETLPDLVLMDIRLKGEMDGIEAASAIRSCLGIPVVYLTANADASTVQRAEMTEPAGYIVKPFQENELRATVQSALEGRHNYLEEGS